MLHLQPRPGTNAAVMHGLAHIVHRDRLMDLDFVAHTAPRAEPEAEEMIESVHTRGRSSGSPASRRRILERAAHIYAEAENACISWGVGVTEHRYGSEVVRLICNLALMTGKIGRPGSALLPLRGQNNVQGSSDMGALPDTYTDVPLGRRRGRRALLRGGLGGPALA